MNRRVARVGWLVVAAFAVLIANLTYLQFIAAGELTAKQQNVRPLLFEKKIRRGDIVSADGAVLATSRKVDGGYARSYPRGELAQPATGFYSMKYGRTGLELAFNEYLSGQTKIASMDDYIKRLLGKDVPGNNLYLTLDTRLQEIASRELRGRKGAAIALDPRTGAVLAMVSEPGFDPNDVDESWKTLSGDPDAALINRATQGRFTPGSSFKIVTAAAALASGEVTTETVYDAKPSVTVYGGKVTNYGGQGYGTMAFADAFAKSVNTVFAQVGTEIGGGALVDTAGGFGVGARVPFDLPTGPSTMPAAGEMDELEVAWAAVGQGRILATPLQMALVAAAVANDGVIMEPYLVERAVEHDGAFVYQRRPRQWRAPVSKETAGTLRDLMVGAVDKGTGTRARIDGVRVAGKTGTAEVGKKEPHAWFVGFAPADDPQVAVAVIIENGGTGGRVAAPIAREIMRATLVKQR